MSRVLGLLKNIKGQRSEDNVDRVLKQLKRDGIIKGFTRSQHLDEHDRRGVDFNIQIERDD